MNRKKSGKDQAANPLVEADGKVAEGVEPVADHPAVRAIAVLSEIGDQPQMRALCVAAIAAGAASGSPRLLRAGVKMLAAHSLATFAKDFIKLRIDRTRPRADRDHDLRPGKGKHKEVTSFPSGHTAGAVAVARAFAREFPEHAHAAYAGAALVSLAQVPRGAHYPTDVGAGAAIALASEAVTDRAISALDRAAAIPAFDTPRPKL